MNCWKITTTEAEKVNMCLIDRSKDLIVHSCVCACFTPVDARFSRYQICVYCQSKAPTQTKVWSDLKYSQYHLGSQWTCLVS